MATHPVAFRAADSDMRLARREGEIAVAETRVGTVFLRHEHGTYSLTTAGLDSRVLAAGKKAVVRPVLAGLYVVTMENPAGAHTDDLIKQAATMLNFGASKADVRQVLLDEQVDEDEVYLVVRAAQVLLKDG